MSREVKIAAFMDSLTEGAGQSWGGVQQNSEDRAVLKCW